MSDEDVQALVVDNGSGMCKVSVNLRKDSGAGTRIRFEDTLSNRRFFFSILSFLSIDNNQTLISSVS
jgi:hypothetical protein